MANILDMFKYSLHQELEGLERDLVQAVQERIVKEGDAFPGGVSKIEATVEVDLNAVLRSAASSRSIRQVQQAEG